MAEIMFCHGFEGRPGGTKAQHLEAAFNTQVSSPALSAHGFGLEAQVGVALAAIDAQPNLRCVVGSSMGGLVAAVAAHRRPDRALRLVLMAPALNIAALWAERLGEAGLAAWAARGSLAYPHAGVGHTVEIPWGALAEAQAQAEVAVTHPAELVHGLDDDVVPLSVSTALLARSPGVTRLTVTPDGHRLLDSLPVMVEAVRRLRGG